MYGHARFNTVILRGGEEPYARSSLATIDITYEEPRSVVRRRLHHHNGGLPYWKRFLIQINSDGGGQSFPLSGLPLPVIQACQVAGEI